MCGGWSNRMCVLFKDRGVLIVDDSIAEKPYTDENDIVCWHYDHAKDRTIKGINSNGHVSCPRHVAAGWVCAGGQDQALP